MHDFRESFANKSDVLFEPYAIWQKELADAEKCHQFITNV